jgi:L-seryl-tRNA(Ser) seleniumtransferase
MTVEKIASRVGGGAMPEQNLESRAVVLKPLNMSVNSLEVSLRELKIPIIGRIEEEKLLFDMRTVADDELSLVAEGLRHVFLESNSVI